MGKIHRDPGLQIFTITTRPKRTRDRERTHRERHIEKDKTHFRNRDHTQREYGSNNRQYDPHSPSK